MSLLESLSSGAHVVRMAHMAPLVIVLLCVSNASGSTPRKAQQPGDIMLTEVNVVDVRNGTLLENFDLLLENGRSGRIGSHGAFPRDRIRRRELPGPDLLVASITLDGKPPISPLNKVLTDPARARQVVDE